MPVLSTAVGGKIVTLKECQDWVAKIGGMIADDENAHVEEDDLYLAILEYFAAVAPPDLANLAKEALKTQKLEFDRWYA
jgi:hypothetical protein